MIIHIIVGYFIIGFFYAFISYLMSDVNSLSEFVVAMISYPFWAGRDLYRTFLDRLHD